MDTETIDDIITLYESPYNQFVILYQLYQLYQCDQITQYILLDNHKKVRLTAVITFRNKIDYYIDGKITYFNLSRELTRYHTLFPKWFHLYKFIVTMNTLGCVDLFNHLVSFYVPTQYIKI